MAEHAAGCGLLSERLGVRVCTCGAEEPPLTKAERDHGAQLLDDLTFSGHSFDGAVSQFALDRRRAEESAVFDFLNWLAPQNIELVEQCEGSPGHWRGPLPLGELWARWKAERSTGP